jgi:hypothetical protein
MKGMNAKFKADPAQFLKTSGYSCAGVVTHSNAGDFAHINGTDIKEFDLVPGAGRFCNLDILGDVGAYAATNRKGSPIVGHFLHWNGQTYTNGPATFGSLDLSQCTADYIFTAPFTGCRFVVTRNQGSLTVYHEPTEEGPCNYAGEVVAQIGPKYTGGGESGNGVIVRKAQGWTAIVSTMSIGSSEAAVEEQDF